jgi:hypothetical protein
MRGLGQQKQLDLEKRMEQTWELKPKIEALLVATNRPVAIQALAHPW